MGRAWGRRLGASIPQVPATQTGAALQAAEAVSGCDVAAHVVAQRLSHEAALPAAMLGSAPALGLRDVLLCVRGNALSPKPEAEVQHG